MSNWIDVRDRLPLDIKDHENEYETVRVIARFEYNHGGSYAEEVTFCVNEDEEFYFRRVNFNDYDGDDEVVFYTSLGREKGAFRWITHWQPRPSTDLEDKL